MAQDPSQDEVLNTHALDMVTLPGGRVNTEIEADMIRGVLDANGIPSLLTAAPQYPNLGFEVRVPRGRVLEAETLIAEAQAAGPEAADEAEAASEANTEAAP
ncbi:MAG: hypothetical protein KGN36_11425 [Acidobacteriota bacterium]|nr:hypothetical protein [Acidobacteriota bacterium]